MITDVLTPGTGSDSTSIQISAERICAIGSSHANIKSKTTISAHGLRVLPGLIDSHVHLFPMGSDAGIGDDAALEEFIRDELPARLHEYLEHGVTTIFSVGDAWPAVRELRSKLESGEIPGPRLLITGPILTAPGGYPAVTICAKNPWCRSRLTVELRDADHARQTVRELATAGVDAIKIVYDDARAEKLDADLVRIVVEEAHNFRLPIIAHVTNITDALEVTKLGADVLAHLPSGGRINANVADQLLKQATIVITTAGVYAPIGGPDKSLRTVFGLPYGPPFDRLHAQGLANADVLLKQGVPLAFGSGTAMFTPAQSLAGERRALFKIPLGSSQLLDTMTINAARALGKENELGSIDIGKLADLIIVKADETSEMASFTDIIMVIKNGQIIIDRRTNETGKTTS